MATLRGEGGGAGPRGVQINAYAGCAGRWRESFYRVECHDPAHLWCRADVQRRKPEVGPVWASVTARFVGMTCDMGNGDTVHCDGPGVPYPDGSNQIQQGSCGYTCTEQPPIDGYTVTVTGHWQVQLVSSFGDNRALDPVDMPYTFDVDELVIVGVGD